VPLVVELEEGGAVRVVVLQVQVVDLGLRGGVTAVFANVHLEFRTKIGIRDTDKISLVKNCPKILHIQTNFVFAEIDAYCWKYKNETRTKNIRLLLKMSFLNQITVL
jgi:hypothetical protein